VALALDWDAVVDGFERFLSGGAPASARARRPRRGPSLDATRPRHERTA
jgi:hypothetical protein